MVQNIPRPQEVLPNPDPSVITTEMIDRAIISLEGRIFAKIDGIDQKFLARLEATDKASASFHDDLVRVPTLLDRSITGLRELLETRLHCLEQDAANLHAEGIRRVAKIEEDIEKRGPLIAQATEHLHDLLASKIDELAAVTAERFIGVASQFAERDTRTDQRAGDTKLAVDAAFAAAKEATGKIEAGFTKQIDSMSEMIDTKTKNADDKIDALRKSADDKINDIKDIAQSISSRLTTLESTRATLDPSYSAALSGMSGDIRMLRETRESVGGHMAGVKDQSASTMSMIAIGISVFMPILMLVVVMMKG